VIAALWRLLVKLIRDLVPSSARDEHDRAAQDDDVLDAWQDDDGMDATGL
jgi:hypothetical protein